MALIKKKYDTTKRRKPGRPRKRHDALLKPSHFNAVEYYMRGFSKKDALLKAGYPLSTATKAPGLVFDRDDVKSAIAERQWKLRANSNRLVDRIKEELASIAFANIAGFLRIDDEGNMIYDFSEASLEELSAVGEVTIETYVEGRGEDAEEVKRVKVKMYDKKAALDTLAKIMGMFSDSSEVTVNLNGESPENRLLRGRERVNKARKDREAELRNADVEDAEYVMLEHEKGD